MAVIVHMETSRVINVNRAYQNIRILVFVCTKTFKEEEKKNRQYEWRGTC